MKPELTIIFKILSLTLTQRKKISQAYKKNLNKKDNQNNCEKCKNNKEIMKNINNNCNHKILSHNNN